MDGCDEIDGAAVRLLPLPFFLLPLPCLYAFEISYSNAILDWSERWSLPSDTD